MNKFVIETKPFTSRGAICWSKSATRVTLLGRCTRNQQTHTLKTPLGTKAFRGRHPNHCVGV